MRNAGGRSRWVDILGAKRGGGGGVFTIGTIHPHRVASGGKENGRGGGGDCVGD